MTTKREWEKATIGEKQEAAYTLGYSENNGHKSWNSLPTGLKNGLIKGGFIANNLKAGFSIF